jgi:hypothetical protein
MYAREMTAIASLRDERVNLRAVRPGFTRPSTRVHTLIA